MIIPIQRQLLIHEADIRLQELQCLQQLMAGRMTYSAYLEIKMVNEQSREIIREQRLALLN